MSITQFEQKVLDELSDIKSRITGVETLVSTFPCASHTSELKAHSIKIYFWSGAIALAGFILNLFVRSGAH
jgi:hypothetical protein